MGVFINNDDHSDVYKTNSQITEPNQDNFKINYFSELMEEQKKVNESLLQSFQELQGLYRKQEKIQMTQWKDIGEQLQELKERSSKQDQFENDAKEKLYQLEANNRVLQDILEKDNALNQDMMEEINLLNASNREIATQLGEYESSNGNLDDKLHELVEFQKQMAENVIRQEEKQNQVISSLENQEALLDKTVRQMDHLRSTLYERASYLAEKIENGYNLTSTFFYKLLTGSDKPLNLLMMRQRKEEDKKESIKNK